LTVILVPYEGIGAWGKVTKETLQNRLGTSLMFSEGLCAPQKGTAAEGKPYEYLYQ
jgi:hypothetical protein